MKISNYNLFGKAKTIGGHFIYNSFTGKYLYFDAGDFCNVKQCLDLNNFEKLNVHLVGKLRDAGIIIEDERDEYSEFCYRKIVNRFSDDSDLNFTILPTTVCNFSCVYCYEDPQNSKVMDINTADGTVKYIAKEINSKAHRSNKLSVTWYGGEPLLNIEMMDYLTNELKQLCCWNELDYSSSIVTNGYLLDKLTKEKLADLKITSMQITLDGTEKLHDTRRKLKNGRGTFRTIVANIKNLRKFSNIKIVIRINVDKNNVENIGALIEFLEREKLLKIVSLSVAPVVCATKYSETYCNESYHIYSRPEFGLAISKKQLELINKKILFQQLPKPLKTGSFCRTESLQSGNVIDPNGNLFGCWHDVSFPERQIGNIYEGKMCNSCYLHKYALQNPVGCLECGSCKVLPLCGGGCPSVLAHGQRFACHDWKNEETIMNIVEATHINDMEIL